MQHVPLWNGRLTRENYAQNYQMTGVHGSCTPVNWPKDSQEYDLDPFADKKFY